MYASIRIFIGKLHRIDRLLPPLFRYCSRRGAENEVVSPDTDFMTWDRVDFRFCDCIGNFCEFLIAEKRCRKRFQVLLGNVYKALNPPVQDWQLDFDIVRRHRLIHSVQGHDLPDLAGSCECGRKQHVALSVMRVHDLDTKIAEDRRNYAERVELQQRYVLPKSLSYSRMRYLVVTIE